MSSTVVIVGPSSPRELAAWLNDVDSERALAVPGLGGSPVNNYVRALLEAGEAVELVTLAPELEEPFTLDGPRLRILAGPYRTRARDRARDFFRAERRQVEALVDQTSGRVVHAIWTYEFALGALASRGRSTVVTTQDAPFTILRYHPDLYRAMRTALAIATRLRAARLVANSPYLASAWRRQMLYRRSIPVVPNVVWPPPAPPRTTHPVGDDAPIILDVSQQGALKNVSALVRAMPRILSWHAGARLRLVGHGLTDASALAVLAEGLGIRDSVEFLGALGSDAVHDAYAGATVFVHASLEESFGMSVAEAMSHGLPIVACAGAGAIPWVLGEGCAGLLVDARRPEEIADAVCRLLDDRPLRVRLGTAAIQRAGSTFSPAAVVAASLQVYEDVEAASR